MQTASPASRTDGPSARFAVLCSGQGFQHEPMSAVLANAPEAEAVFAKAATLLDGRDPRSVMAEDPEFATTNRAGQVICCAQALAGWAVIASKLPTGTVVVGYSVGDLAAWGCAGRFAAGEVLDLASVRARLMDEEAGQGGGLAGVRGLGREQLDALIRPRGLEVAIVNAADSFVVGGDREELRRMCDEALERGAERAVVLSVSIPSHTSRLGGAARRFLACLRGVTTRPSPPREPRLMNGLDGSWVEDSEAGMSKLARQLAEPIDWAACLMVLRGAGVTRVLELGPGHALATMAKWTLPEAEVYAMDGFRTRAGLRSWLARPENSAGGGLAQRA